ncbi:unnamed protein product [Strongylus vulgaris]|uniref:Uncharacterized protein n=1 Tax=Strongylus vulgaris TaxID=40348 RepID=A0A3P7JBA7_STRVU|nr:unnamed protein product [Strongylus vulgaris]
MVFRNCAFDRRDYGSEKHLVYNFIEVLFLQKDLDPTQPVASTALQARVTKEWQSNATLKHFFFNMVLNNSVVVNKTPHHDELEVGFFEHGIYNIGNSSFYDITQDQFKEMVAKVKNQLPELSRSLFFLFLLLTGYLGGTVEFNVYCRDFQ